MFYHFHYTLLTLLVSFLGFIGSKIIDELCNYDCGPYLKVFSRGDYSCKEWRSRGLKADSSLIALLKGQRPDIIIINVENSSYSAICHLIKSSNILSPGTLIISTTFGFQRKKIFNNFKVPSIFRTFVEPQQRSNEIKAK